MFLLESKEKRKKKIYYGCVCVFVALELQSNDSQGENIQTWKSS